MKKNFDIISKAIVFIKIFDLLQLNVKISNKMYELKIGLLSYQAR